MMPVVLVAPDDRYLTHICPHGQASLSKRLDRAMRMSDGTATRYRREYQLIGYVALEVEP